MQQSVHHRLNTDIKITRQGLYAKPNISSQSTLLVVRNENMQRNHLPYAAQENALQPERWCERRATCSAAHRPPKHHESRLDLASLPCGRCFSRLFVEGNYSFDQPLKPFIPSPRPISSLSSQSLTTHHSFRKTKALRRRTSYVAAKNKH